MKKEKKISDKFKVPLDTAVKVGDKIKCRRVEMDLTKGGVAKESEMNPQEITGIEEGMRQKLNPFHIRALSEALEMDYMELMHDIGYVNSMEYGRYVNGETVNKSNEKKLREENELFKKTLMELDETLKKTQKDFEDMHEAYESVFKYNNMELCLVSDEIQMFQVELDKINKKIEECVGQKDFNVVDDMVELRKEILGSIKALQGLQVKIKEGADFLEKLDQFRRL